MGVNRDVDDRLEVPPDHAWGAGPLVAVRERDDVPRLEFTVRTQTEPRAKDLRRDRRPVPRPRANRERRLAVTSRLLAFVVVLQAIALVVVVSSKSQPRRPTSATSASRAAAHTRLRDRRRVNIAARLAPYPGVDAMSDASAYLEARAGTNAFAVVNSRGKEFGLYDHRLYVSASTMKSMLLVAYLRNLAAQHETVGAQSASLLQPMIHVSDNNAAEAVWDIVGNSGLERIAQLSGMTDFTAGVDWANELISCADMARFFYKMDSLIPRQFRSYARGLLAAVEPTESWGIPQVARPGWSVYFKGGWRGTAEGELVSQIGRLEQRGRKLAIAVMTVGDPSMYYGEQTIAGVAARLLSGSSPALS